jgi:hypothetical protein
MPYLLSEDFVRNRLGRLMAGRDERFFRDSKLTGFLLRVRRAAEGNTLLRTWFIEQPTPGKTNPRKVIIGDKPPSSTCRTPIRRDGGISPIARIPKA